MKKLYQNIQDIHIKGGIDQLSEGVSAMDKTLQNITDYTDKLTNYLIKYSSSNDAHNEIPYDEGAFIRFYNQKLAGIVLAKDETEFNASDSNQGWGHKGDVVRFFWDECKENDSKANAADFGAVEITISPNTFPGTYRVVGDTFMRNRNGKDEPFQFVIEKAKVQSNVTLTLEAEGDPTTFEMTLQVLRADSGDEMMKLVRYGTEADDDEMGNDFGSLTTDSTSVSYTAKNSTTSDGGTTSEGGDGTNSDNTDSD